MIAPSITLLQLDNNLIGRCDCSLQLKRRKTRRTNPFWHCRGLKIWKWLIFILLFYLYLDLHFNRLITGQLARQPACASVRGPGLNGLQTLPVERRQLAAWCAFQRCQKNPFLILRSPAGSLLLERHHTEHMTLLIRGTPCDWVKLKKDHFGLLANCLSECYRSQCDTYSKIVWLSLGLSREASAASHEVERIDSAWI